MMNKLFFCCCCLSTALFVSCSSDEPAAVDEQGTLDRLTAADFKTCTAGKVFYEELTTKTFYVNGKGESFSSVDAGIAGGNEPTVKGYYFTGDKCEVLYRPYYPNVEMPAKARTSYDYVYNTVTGDVTLYDETGAEADFSFRVEKVGEGELVTRTAYGCLDLGFKPNESFTSQGMDKDSYRRSVYTEKTADETTQLLKEYEVF